MPKNQRSVLRQQAEWKDLWFYRKAESLYHLSVAFTRRFLPKYGDRTVDQMVQAARSGKQNIVEGSSDGVASSELEIRLLNVARSSIQELREDFLDYLRSHRLALWDERHSRFKGMMEFCRKNNDLSRYEPYFDTWSDEEMANVGYTLCRMTDKMMTTYLQKLDAKFVSEGGIRERMTAARIGYRNDLRRQLEDASHEIASLKAEIQRLKAIISTKES